MTYEILWRFEVPAANAAAFEEAYGPGGAWAKLFAKAAGFIEVRLLKAAGCYITIDRWTSKQAHEDFHAAFAGEYRALDKALEGLASAEIRIGDFESV